MYKINIKFLAESAIIAALYVALTWALSPISFGSVQFRISEVLVLLVFINPKFSIALIIGCFISNTTSPLGWWDMVFGTLATALAVIPMIKIKNLYLSALMPVISNAIIVSIELYYSLNISPVWLSMITVGLGEACVLYLVGIPLIISINKNEALLELMDSNKKEIKAPEFLTFLNTLAIALIFLGVIFFIAYPLYIIYGDENVTVSALTIIKDNWWSVFYLIIPLLYGVAYFITKNKILKLVLCIVISLSLFVPFILVLTSYSDAAKSVYFYSYIIYIALLIVMSLISYNKEVAIK
ncbi:MAG: QueT transporter family protein [Acholeplasmatales bacterium]|nr:QueT transporter family protein [Acholeplasmatales bacterium]